MENPKSHPVIFVHGAWHGQWCWDKYFAPQFSERGYQTHTFDLPGHGEMRDIAKGQLNRLSTRDYIDTLKKRVSEVGGSPILVGHSMGGFIIQKYLETDSCAKAVLLAPVPRAGVAATTIRLLTSKAYVLAAILRMNLKLIVDEDEKAKWAFFSDNIDDAELREYCSQMSGESYRAFLEMLWPRIKPGFHREVPMLIVGATNDRIFTVNEVTKTAQSYGADCQIVDDIAHNLMLDPGHEAIGEIVLNWLDQAAPHSLPGPNPTEFK